VVLKITHIPIVAIIWLFESLHHQVNGGPLAFSSFNPSATNLTLNTSNAAKKQKQRPFLSKSNHTKTGSIHFPDILADDGSHSPGPQDYIVTGRKEVNTPQVVNNTLLEKKVDDLQAKIEELTALILSQQGNSPDDP
jgi:hypothetical protein